MMGTTAQYPTGSSDDSETVAGGAWTAADTGEAVAVDTSALSRVMDLGVTARLLGEGWPDVRIHAVQGRKHGWEVFCYTCSDVVGLLDTEEEAIRERAAHIDEAHNAGRAR